MTHPFWMFEQSFTIFKQLKNWILVVLLNKLLTLNKKSE